MRTTTIRRRQNPPGGPEGCAITSGHGPDAETGRIPSRAAERRRRRDSPRRATAPEPELVLLGRREVLHLHDARTREVRDLPSRPAGAVADRRFDWLPRRAGARHRRDPRGHACGAAEIPGDPGKARLVSAPR